MGNGFRQPKKYWRGRIEMSGSGHSSSSKSKPLTRVRSLPENRVEEQAARTTASPLSPSVEAISQPQMAPVHASDVETMDAIIRAMYAVISGPAGQERDWDRFRSLFWPGACMILAVAQEGKKPNALLLEIEDYIRRTDPIFAGENFWETEKARKTRIFGNIAHVFSTYESRREKNGPAFQRGINSIQLFCDGTRWWIVTVMWNTERGRG
jgi:hypothetical protein